MRRASSPSAPTRLGSARSGDTATRSTMGGDHRSRRFCATPLASVSADRGEPCTADRGMVGGARRVGADHRRAAADRSTSWAVARPNKPTDLDEASLETTVRDEIGATDPALVLPRAAVPVTAPDPRSVDIDLLAAQALVDAGERSTSTGGRSSVFDLRAGAIRALSRTGIVVERSQLDGVIADIAERAMRSVQRLVDGTLPSHVKAFMATETVRAKIRLAGRLDALARQGAVVAAGRAARASGQRGRFDLRSLTGGCVVRHRRHRRPRHGDRPRRHKARRRCCAPHSSGSPRSGAGCSSWTPRERRRRWCRASRGIGIQSSRPATRPWVQMGARCGQRDGLDATSSWGGRCAHRRHLHGGGAAAATTESPSLDPGAETTSPVDAEGGTAAYQDVGGGVSIPAKGPGDCPTWAIITPYDAWNLAARLFGAMTDFGPTAYAYGEVGLDDEGEIAAYAVASATPGTASGTVSASTTSRCCPTTPSPSVNRSSGRARS